VLEVIDITVPVHDGMTGWPGLLPTRLEPGERMERGDSVNVTNCHFCAHVGTHIDAPFHHFREGASIDRVSLRGLIGKACVLDLAGVETGVCASDLARFEDKLPVDVLLLKTRNSTTKKTWHKFDPQFIYLEPDGAEWIRDRGIKGVAIDCLGIERYGRADGATHKTLLGAGIALIEGVDLRAVEPGMYWFACLPVKLAGCDAAPARAILIRDQGGAFLRAWEHAATSFREDRTTGS